MSVRYARIGIAAAALALLSGCHARVPEGCAGIRFNFSANTTLHIGVLGKHTVSDSPCFKLVKGTGQKIEVRKDPVSTDWDEVSSFTFLPVAESLIADAPKGSYTLIVPESWTRYPNAQIAFGAPDMDYSDSVTKEDFFGHPRIATIKRDLR